MTFQAANYRVQVTFAPLDNRQRRRPIVPNPFTDKIIITNKSNNPIRVQLYDMLGKHLTTVQNIIGVYNLRVGQFKQAYYIIVVTDETTKKQKRRLLVKK